MATYAVRFNDSDEANNDSSSSEQEGADRDLRIATAGQLAPTQSVFEMLERVERQLGHLHNQKQTPRNTSSTTPFFQVTMNELATPNSKGANVKQEKRDDPYVVFRSGGM